MMETSLRGSRLGTTSYETDLNVILADRTFVAYDCPRSHRTVVPFSVEAPGATTRSKPYEEWTLTAGTDVGTTTRVLERMKSTLAETVSRPSSACSARLSASESTM